MLKARQKFGKYRIQRRLAEGGFAVVYQAMDTIEGIQVALKLPHPHLINTAVLEDFRREVRLAAKLDHPNILPLKNATFIDGQFVIAYALGDRSFDERLQHRMSFLTALDYAEQILSAVAYAHRQGIIHCDIKPENLILFPNHRIRLTDFGIARVANRTLRASGSGTVGYMSPEQAMGRLSFRSDVFSLGLILCRMFSGVLPEWPFKWPPKGYDRLRRKLHPEMIRVLERSLEVVPRRRFADAEEMLNAFLRAKRKAILFHQSRRRSATSSNGRKKSSRRR